jgi:hypothetical protein
VIPITYPDGHGSDFPIFLKFQNELGLIFLATKQGLLFVFEVSQGSLLLRSKISQGHLLTGCSLENSKGIMMVGKQGDLIYIEVVEQNLVNFIKQSTHIQNNTIVA